KNNLLLFLFFLLFSASINAQIEKVIVETYYISDTLDATDTIDGSIRALPAGSKTYRVYIDLKPGYKLAKIFGDANHAFKITSTANFFNNIDRPNEYFGYLAKKTHFSTNPTYMLDSWITLGLATSTYYGVLKPQDTTGTIRTAGWGGTAGIAGGILKNNDPAAGIPLTNEDGFLPIPGTVTFGSWIDNGFRTVAGRDTTVFGDTIIGSQFISNTAYLQQTSGVAGVIADSNQILVAQLTTQGIISFELNVDIIDTSTPPKHFIYVAKSSSADSYTINPYLTYPTTCGCTDNRYLEYSASFACGDSTYCHTLKVYGCTDTMACNYDPSANVLLSDFCCYPGYCNDRNIALVCPDISPYRLKQNHVGEDIYPNPVQNILSLQLSSSIDFTEVNYEIYDTYGRIIVQQDLGIISGNSLLQADLSGIPSGLYLFKVSVAGVSSIKKFIKN
ncbi:MAG: T9SS type A sorting domain-containing protein, partial [Bacteroidia bacterium]